MRTAATVSGILLVVIVLWVLFVLSPAGSQMPFKRFEQKVMHSVDPAELQAWAAGLLATHPGEDIYYLDYYGTNLPSGLKRIEGYHHWVQINTGEHKERWVIVFGSRGEPSLLVGPPTFVHTNPGAEMWRPGIYFVPARE